MSRISKYQEHVRDFLLNKSLIKTLRSDTQKIMLDIVNKSDHYVGILCLTIINYRCKQSNIKMHGYHLASGIEALMIVAQILNNRTYYESVYSANKVSNAISDITNWFYECVAENIKTLDLSNEIDSKTTTSITLNCTRYASRCISKILEFQDKPWIPMKKTDVFCMDFDAESIDNYVNMNRLSKDQTIKNIKNTYGLVCRIAICLGWILGMGDDKNIKELETMADNIGLILKIRDDFINYKRDMRFGKYSYNFVTSHGIKEALILFDEANIAYAENLFSVGVETKTCNEIVKAITEYVNEMIQNISVDIDTEYDDTSLNTLYK